MSVLARTCNANQIKLACPFKMFDAMVWLLCLSGLTHESHGHSPETVYLSFGFETHLASSRHLISRHKPSQACWVRNAKLCQPGGWTYRNRLLASQHFTAIFDLNDVASWAQASHRYCNRSKARKYTSCSFDIRKPLQLGVSWCAPKSRGIFLVILSFRPLQYYILYWPLKAVNRSAAQNGHRAKQSKTWLHEGYNLEPVIPSDCSHAHWTSGKNNFLN